MKAIQPCELGPAAQLDAWFVDRVDHPLARYAPRLAESMLMATPARSHLDSRTTAALRELTQLNIDSRDGFDYAAERIEEDAPVIATMFRNLSDERSRNAEQFEALLIHSGEDAPEDGSWTATMHRTWMNIRDMLTVKLDIYAVVAEAERGEDVIKHAYEEACNEVCGAVANLINDQYTGIKRAHDAVRDLRDSLKNESQKADGQK